VIPRGSPVTGPPSGCRPFPCPRPASGTRIRRATASAAASHAGSAPRLSARGGCEAPWRRRSGRYYMDGQQPAPQRWKYCRVVYLDRAAVPVPGLANSSASFWRSCSDGRFLVAKPFTSGAFPFLASRSNCFTACFCSSAAILR